MDCERTNLLNLDRAGLSSYFEEMGEKPFRAQQVMKWIYHQGLSDFGMMNNLSKVLRDELGQRAEIRPPEVINAQTSADGTIKWLLKVGGRGNAVETVFIPEPSRGTLCVSSQVGCALNCTFCSTGAQGFSRNLSAAEIIGQVLVAARTLGHDSATNRRITNVVLMGMGEPLLNFDNVVTAMSIMCDDLGFGLAGKRVTLSTAGLVPGIERLAGTMDVSLAVSLHAPNDELRNVLVPLNRKYPIKQLMQACRLYLKGKNKARVTFEYTLINSVNDSEWHAEELVKVLRQVPCKLNLIPFNPFPGTQYRRSTDAAIARFQKIVLDAGLVATLRKTRGADIDAACGQLAGKVIDRTRRSERLRARAAVA